MNLSLKKETSNRATLLNIKEARKIFGHLGKQKLIKKMTPSKKPIAD